MATYFGNFDDAEKLYRDMDRRDLALELRSTLGDWFKVVQLVQQGGGDDNMLQMAWNKIGDYFWERQKPTKAVQYYGQAKNVEMQVAPRCHLLEGSTLTQTQTPTPTPNPVPGGVLLPAGGLHGAREAHRHAARRRAAAQGDR